jgi:hypothetical protein
MRSLALLLTLLLAPLGASAINTALCNNADESAADGDEVPSFAVGRDANGCLLINPGNGESNYSIQYEFFHEDTVGNACSGSTVDLKNNADSAKTILVWDTVMDNYKSTACKNKDVMFTGSAGGGYSYELFWFKNSKIINMADCGASGNFGPASDPNRFQCSGPAGGHHDLFQLRGAPANDGWFIMQDSIFANGHHGMLDQTDPFFGSLGSNLIQGVQMGNVQAMGEATDWITDCIQNGHSVGLCNNSSYETGGGPEKWFINSWGTMTVSFNDRGPPDKTIIVNTGCGTTGCNGTTGYSSNGWPHPLAPNGLGSRSPTCPNAQINTSPDIYCYTSMEAAVAVHTMPPFAKLSCAGWATPPAECGGGGVPPLLGIQTSVTTPVDTGDPHSLSATVTGCPGGATCTVTWDCDGDGQFDDGSPDTASPYGPQACTAFVSPGTYTVRARATDNISQTVSDDATLIVVTPETCGDNVIGPGETCDGTELNGLDCTDEPFGFTGGTLACDPDCLDYDTSACTGTPPVSCGDGLCIAPENATTCYEDCEVSIISLVCNTFEGWDYCINPIASGSIVNRRIGRGQQMNIIAEPALGATSAYRFVFDGDDNSPYSVLQNSPLYSMCGDTGSSIDTSLPCTPPIPVGTHTIEITACNQNFSGTFNVPPYTDARCTDGGGKLGPTQTVTFTVVNRQVSQFLRRTMQIGMGNALVELASAIRDE